MANSHVSGLTSSPPSSAEELMARVAELAGRTLAEVAERYQIPVPEERTKAKGFAGQLAELHLGASASSRAEPDFPHLGIELKTLPLSEEGKPKESTYVCVAPLDGRLAAAWPQSWVRRKLARVLWLPLLRRENWADTQFGTGFLWSPSAEEEGLLRGDWEELTELIREGQLWQINARRGKVLQLRPKAAHGKDFVWTFDEAGEWVQAMPRGFYLRPSFTASIVANHFGLP